MLLAFFVFLACAPGTQGPSSAGAEWEAPDNRWPSQAPPADLVAGGYDEGDVPPDVRMPDQFGDEVSLWQFYGNLVVVNVAPMWCAPCQDLAAGVEPMMEEYEGESVVFIELVAETVEGETPTMSDAEEWAETFGIESSPVLADTSGFYVNFSQGGAYPVVVGIGADMVVFEGGFVPVDGEDDIRAFIDANL